MSAPLAPPASRGPRLRARLALAAAALGVLAARGGLASPSPGRLAVARSAEAADCPDTAALGAMVARLSVAPPGAPANGSNRPAAEVTVDVQMTRGPGGYSAELRVSGGARGVRTLADKGPSCDGLADAVAVTVALLLDGREERDAPAPSASVAPRAAPTAPAAPPAAPKSVAVVAFAGVSAAAGLSPRAAPVPELGAELRFRPGLVLSVGGFFVPGQTQPFGPGSVDVSLLAASLRGCFRAPLGFGRLVAGACAELAAGQLRGDGAGYAPSRSARTLWTAAGLGLDIGRPLAGPVAIRISGRTLAPLPHQTFSVDHVDGVAFDPPRVAFLGGAAVEVSIW